MEMNEEGYLTEDVLQTLLAKYPNLLAGDQMNNEAPRRWLLVSREASLPSEEGGAGRWAVDHLFLDQDAIPTLVEVKRSTDTRIRREVVGQMLDYAANAVVYWPAEKIRAQFEANYQVQGLEPEQVITDFLDPETNPEDFWQRMKTNLQAGNIRLVFVADKIPSELQRIVEFLNGQMDPAEVLALEVKQYMGQGLKTLVPKIIGRTAAAQEKKSSGSREARQWDEQSFFDELRTKGLYEESEIALKVMEWSKVNKLGPSWGRGGVIGSFYPTLVYQGKKQGIIVVYTDGRIVIQFQIIRKFSPFNGEPKIVELLKRLNKLPEVSIPPDAINRYPSLPLSLFKDEEVLKQFLGIFDWVIQEIKSESKDEEAKNFFTIED